MPIVIGSASFANQSLLNSTLDTLNAATPIKIIATGGATQAEQWAAAWAATKGIPVLFLTSYLDAAGFIYSNKGLAMMCVTKLLRLLTAGTSARITAAIAAAPTRPTPVVVTQI
jgi:hypothetical protein